MRLKPLLIVAAIAGAVVLGVSGYRMASAAATPPESAALRRRPNILLITVDALRADHVGVYGYDRITSSAIDAFSRRAARIEDAIAQAPYTKASIASLMTGLYPSSHNTVTASVPFLETMTGHLTTRPPTTDVLPPSATTIAQALRAAGYRTIGFTTNPFLIDAFGFGRGFDLFRFYPGGDFAGANQVVGDAIETVRRTDRTRPLFLWVHLMEPHSPYVPPPWTAGMFTVAGAPEPIPRSVDIPDWLIPGSPRDRRIYVAAYDDEIAAADVAVDTLLREFGDVRPSRPSVVVLTADHGEQFLEHHGWEHSSNLHDELIRVPLLIKAPGIAPGAVHAQAELIDVFPTLLEFAGADPVDTAGHSLVPVLQRAEGSHPAVSEIVGAQRAIRDDGWKLIAFTSGRVQLFDLAHDPAERHDVAAAQPARVHRLQAMLDRTVLQAAERGRRIGRHTAPIDPAVANRLRSLGYIQ